MLTFKVLGDEQVSRGFSRFAEDVKDLSAAFREIVKDFHESEQRQFESQGDYGAGGWQPLASTTIERKERGGFPLDILVRTGALKESLAGKTGHTIEVIKPLEMQVGTTLPYARFHQEGTGIMPARPIIMLPEEQKTRMHKIIHRYLVKQAGKRFQ